MQKLKKHEAQPKFTGSYKKKRALSVLYTDYSDSRLLHVEGGTTINTGHISMYLSDNLLNLKLCHEI